MKKKLAGLKDDAPVLQLNLQGLEDYRTEAEQLIRECAERLGESVQIVDVCRLIRDLKSYFPTNYLQKAKEIAPLVVKDSSVFSSVEEMLKYGEEVLAFSGLSGNLEIQFQVALLPLDLDAAFQESLDLDSKDRASRVKHFVRIAISTTSFLADQANLLPDDEGTERSAKILSVMGQSCVRELSAISDMLFNLLFDAIAMEKARVNIEDVFEAQSPDQLAQSALFKELKASFPDNYISKFQVVLAHSVFSTIEDMLSFGSSVLERNNLENTPEFSFQVGVMANRMQARFMQCTGLSKQEKASRAKHFTQIAVSTTCLVEAQCELLPTLGRPDKTAAVLAVFQRGCPPQLRVVATTFLETILYEAIRLDNVLVNSEAVFQVKSPREMAEDKRLQELKAVFPTSYSRRVHLLVTEQPFESITEMLEFGKEILDSCELSSSPEHQLQAALMVYQLDRTFMQCPELGPDDRASRAKHFAAIVINVTTFLASSAELLFDQEEPSQKTSKILSVLEQGCAGELRGVAGIIQEAVIFEALNMERLRINSESKFVIKTPSELDTMKQIARGLINKCEDPQFAACYTALIAISAEVMPSLNSPEDSDRESPNIRFAKCKFALKYLGRLKTYDRREVYLFLELGAANEVVFVAQKVKGVSSNARIFKRRASESDGNSIVEVNLAADHPFQPIYDQQGLFLVGVRSEKPEGQRDVSGTTPEKTHYSQALSDHQTGGTHPIGFKLIPFEKVPSGYQTQQDPDRFEQVVIETEAVMVSEQPGMTKEKVELKLTRTKPQAPEILTILKSVVALLKSNPWDRLDHVAMIIMGTEDYFTNPPEGELETEIKEQLAEIEQRLCNLLIGHLLEIKQEDPSERVVLPYFDALSEGRQIFFMGIFKKAKKVASIASEVLRETKTKSSKPETFLKTAQRVLEKLLTLLTEHNLPKLVMKLLRSQVELWLNRELGVLRKAMDEDIVTHCSAHNIPLVYELRESLEVMQSQLLDYDFKSVLKLAKNIEGFINTGRLEPLHANEKLELITLETSDVQEEDIPNLLRPNIAVAVATRLGKEDGGDHHALTQVVALLNPSVLPSQDDRLAANEVHVPYVTEDSGLRDSLLECARELQELIEKEALNKQSIVESIQRLATALLVVRMPTDISSLLPQLGAINEGNVEESIDLLKRICSSLLSATIRPRVSITIEKETVVSILTKEEKAKVTQGVVQYLCRFTKQDLESIDRPQLMTLLHIIAVTNPEGLNGTGVLEHLFKIAENLTGKLLKVLAEVIGSHQKGTAQITADTMKACMRCVAQSAKQHCSTESSLDYKKVLEQWEFDSFKAQLQEAIIAPEVQLTTVCVDIDIENAAKRASLLLTRAKDSPVQPLEHFLLKTLSEDHGPFHNGMSIAERLDDRARLEAIKAWCQLLPETTEINGTTIVRFISKVSDTILQL